MFSHILWECRESALRPTRALPGVPLKAAAGQATTIKPQTDREFQCLDVAMRSWARVKVA